MLYLLVHNREKTIAAEAESKQEDAVLIARKNYRSFRQNDLQYTKPLMLFENETESPALLSVKRNVSFKINKLVNEGTLTSASVYMCRLNSDEWFSVNRDELFMPSSLIKIPYLMIYLKESEKNPAILDKKLTMDSQKDFLPKQSYVSKAIEFGKPYSIRELLKYMIAYSDNNATYLLDINLDYPALQKMFVDVGMEEPDLSKRDYKLAVFDYSKFFHILYSSTFLNHENSNYALSLLTETDFKIGMMTGIPPGITVAHKFGEGGVIGPGGIRELHESGIIYLKGEPILVTISTKGLNIDVLPNAIGTITKEIVSGVMSNFGPSQTGTTLR